MASVSILEAPGGDAPHILTGFRSIADRLGQAQRAMAKYPCKTPVIVECGEVRKRFLYKSGVKLPQLDSSRFLVPNEMTVAQFCCVIRKRYSELVTPDTAIFMLIKNVLPKNTALMKELWDEHRGEDSCLTITILPEHTFGCSTSS
jgi:hypothetical protein